MTGIARDGVLNKIVRKFLYINIFLFTILLAGCATPYQSKSFVGGFSETQIAEDIFIINFEGNGFTSRTRASDFTLLRCAELTLQNNFKYFIVLDSSNYEKKHFYVQGKNINTILKPGNDYKIRMFNENVNDGGLIYYDAEFIKKSIQSKYRMNN